MVIVAAEILRAEFPIARYPPLECATEGFPIAVGAVRQLAIIIEIEPQIAEVILKRRGFFLPAGVYETAIGVDPCLDQSPFRFVELVAVTGLHLRDADQSSLIGEDPGVERAHEFPRVAFVIATDPHAPVATIV